MYWKFAMDDWDLDEKPLGKWQLLHIVNLKYPCWQIMLGLHLVLATLHGWFTISIEQDK